MALEQDDYPNRATISSGRLPDLFNRYVGLTQGSIDKFYKTRAINDRCSLVLCLEPVYCFHLSLPDCLQELSVTELLPNNRQTESRLIQIRL